MVVVVVLLDCGGACSVNVVDDCCKLSRTNVGESYISRKCRVVQPVRV